MIEFGGTIYYIDIDWLDKVITPKNSKPDDEVVFTEIKTTYDSKDVMTGYEVNKTISLKGKEIEGPKYDIVREMIMVLLNSEEPADTALGSERALNEQSLSYKLAFNTLMNYGILKEKE
jgi:hypothetical protein